MTLDRRGFIGATMAGATALSAPAVLGAARPNVVVIGGGAGGATAARYIAKDSGGAINVTLIEPSRIYYSCFFSNLVIGGIMSYDIIGHGYGPLASDYGVNVIHDWAVGVDRDAKTVRLGGGATLPYDKLILSPGIDFVDGSVPGWDVSQQNRMPHAYKAGSQTELLEAQVDAMPEGGTFVMVAPPNPYRCPPGPYERISMIAHIFKQKNPTAKILVFDPKEKFSKQTLFEEGWLNHYEGMIDWVGGDFGMVESVDPEAMTVTVDGEVIEVDVCNVIPGQKAGRIAELAGVTDDSGWAPVNAADMSAKAAPDIYVLGDSSLQGDMPKSGYAANSQAKVCATAVRAALSGAEAPAARYENICWSLIAPEDGVKVGASYEATPEKISQIDGFISQTGEDAELRKKTYEESVGWYAAITADIFG
ncbi:FAD-dependent oxidoreductase [Rhodobacteraceae bacterium NNCM2]|nr:FAD-dependent oxidoreductase [Coraliihabitans acroporae]